MEGAVKRALGTAIFKATGQSGGGCISSGSTYLTDNGEVFVKVNSKPNALTMFEGEKAGLEAILATGTVRCPRPLEIVKEGGSVALVMENLKMTSLSSKQQAVLGEQLARMHLYNKSLLEKCSKEEQRVGCSKDEGGGDAASFDYSKPVTKFGFHIPTCCGYLSQDNSWEENWTKFYVNRKLQAQVDMILRKGGDRELNDLWPLCRQNIEEKLSKLENVVPALVHGDLWSGNVASADNEPVIFDPASFYGHSEYDFGIANMFSGFTTSFYNAYFKVIPKAEGFSDREDIYELFHHLNHWNHFGSGYRGSTISLMKRILKA